MAAFNFPNSPSTNDLHTENNVTWKWNGTVWKRINNSYLTASTLNITGIGTFGGVLKIPTVAGTNTNSDLNVLFQTATGVIDGGSGLTYNPGGDVLSVNGNFINLNTFRGAGSLATLTCSNHSSTTGITVSNKIDIKTVDNTAGAFKLVEGSNEYITVDTTNSSELIKFGTAGSERLRITSAGNILAGRNSDYWSSRAAFQEDKQGRTAILVKNDTNHADASSCIILNASGNSWTMNCGSTARDSNSFTINQDATSNSNQGTERFRIDTSGNIGLGGITSPLWTTGGGMHLNDAYGIGFGNGGSGRPDFQIVTTVGATLDFRCGFGADTADIVMNTSGYFGIGDASPTKPLTVGTATPVVLLDDQSSRTLEIRGPSTTHNATVLTTSNHDLLLGTNNTERLRIRSDGSVLMGPSPALAAIGAGPTLGINGAAPEITLRDTSTNNPYAWIATNDYGSLVLAADQGNNVGSSIIDFRVDGTERMRITSDGKVIIRSQGATVSDGYAALEIRQNTGGKHLILATNSATSSTNEVMLGFKLHPSGQDERVKAAIICRGTGSNDYGQPQFMSFCLDPTGDNANATVANDEKLRIDSAGRLSVGRNLSSYVASSMSSAANDFIVTTGAGANGGMTIVNSGSDIGNIFFAEGTGENSVGRIQYEHTNNALSFTTNSSERLRIKNDGETEFKGQYLNHSGSGQKCRTFAGSITLGDGAVGNIMLNTSGYTRGFFEVWIISYHGSIGRAHWTGEQSRYSGNDNYVNSNSMGYCTLDRYQDGVNNNGIRITRTGTYGNVTFNFYGRAISANGTSNWTSGYTKFLDGAF